MMLPRATIVSAIVPIVGLLYVRRMLVNGVNIISHIPTDMNVQVHMNLNCICWLRRSFKKRGLLCYRLLKTDLSLLEQFIFIMFKSKSGTIDTI